MSYYNAANAQSRDYLGSNSSPKRARMAAALNRDANDVSIADEMPGYDTQVDRIQELLIQVKAIGEAPNPMNTRSDEDRLDIFDEIYGVVLDTIELLRSRIQSRQRGGKRTRRARKMKKKSSKRTTRR